jgi:O-acetyl-ADP-ribose deacetylase (regulator of RNase III)
MLPRLVLVDINSKMVKAWQDVFAGNPEVEVVQGSMLQQQVDAWVTPTNGRGKMDGGLDGVLKSHFGPSIERAVQAAIKQDFEGYLGVCQATCVATGQHQPKFVISTATMGDSQENVSNTLNVALATGAALQAAVQQNNVEYGSISSIALPGLGANTGGVSPYDCAGLMWRAYQLLLNQSYADMASLRVGLEQDLVDVPLGKTQVSTKL